jgi:hypothetical protein
MSNKQHLSLHKHRIATMANVYQQCHSGRRCSSSSDITDYEHPLPVLLNSGASNYHIHLQVSASAAQNRANRAFNESSDNVVVNDNQDLARIETNDSCIEEKSTADDLPKMPIYKNHPVMVSLNYNALKFHSQSEDSFDTDEGTLMVQRNESRHMTKNRLSLLAAEHKNKKEVQKYNSDYENIDKSESSTNGCENPTPQSHSHERVVQVNEQLATSTSDIGEAYEVSYSE